MFGPTGNNSDAMSSGTSMNPQAPSVSQNHQDAGNTAAPTGQFVAAAGDTSVDRDQVYQWILDLGNPKSRENALLELRLVHLFLFLQARPIAYLS